MRLAVLQSNYIPWKGYFDLMAMADRFVIYDSTQYTKNDWRNRNRIVAGDSVLWLTIPVKTSGKFGQPINEARIQDGQWTRKHWATISQNYARRSRFADYADAWEDAYSVAQGLSRLHDVNTHFLKVIALQLGITTPLVDDRQFQLERDTPTGKLVQMCMSAGADRYVTGPSALKYLDVKRFHDRGIAVDVIDYGHYPVYDQGWRGFEHGVSALDLLTSVGSNARSHLMGRFRTLSRDS